MFKLNDPKVKYMLGFDRRTIWMYIVTGSIMGTSIALFIDAIKQNPWLLIYQSFVFGWLLLLTGIAAAHIKRRVA